MPLNVDKISTGSLSINGTEITGDALQTVAVDGVTITGDGTLGNPLVAVGEENHYIGELIGGGIVVALWKESDVEKALIASLTNLSTGIQWTLPALQSIAVGPAARSFMDGLSNTNAIILQTTAPAANTYAAGLARLHSNGGYNDWYLPSNWELNMCYNSATIVNKVLGTESFTGSNYWSSTEIGAATAAWAFSFASGNAANTNKGGIISVRAVRTHTF
jgi:hypothetical protein